MLRTINNKEININPPEVVATEQTQQSFVENKNVIDEFRGEYYFLSNFFFLL